MIGLRPAAGLRGTVLAVVAGAIVAATVGGAPGAQALPISLSAATAAPTGRAALPFPLTVQTGAGNHLVFAHYFPPYPISLDNKPAASDYYTTQYLRPSGENGTFAKFGGLLRDRPVAQAPLVGDWQLANMQEEVRRATAAGIDGFTVDVLDLSAQNWDRTKLLFTAAHTVNPAFRIMLMPDSPATAAGIDTMAARLAELAKLPSAYHLPDGRLVVSPFDAESQTPAWWSSWMNVMKSRYGITVALVPCFLDFTANAKNFASISYGFSDWGNRSVAGNAQIKNNPATAHSMGKIWMQPVSMQDERPRSAIYDEADATENLRATWNGAIAAADWVQLTTWNDYSEGTQFAPSNNTGWTYLDISSYYLARFKTGAWPRITRDAIFLSHRIQQAATRPRAPEQTVLMALRPYSSPARDGVEVLTMLTAPATVTAFVGSRTYRFAAPAGLSAKVLPMAAGHVSAATSRANAVTAKIVSPFPLTRTPWVQNLQYFAAESIRVPPRPVQPITGR